MSMEAVAPVRNLSARNRAREIRYRLMNPKGGRDSTELEIVPAYQTRPRAISPLTQDDIDRDRRIREGGFLEAWGRITGVVPPRPKTSRLTVSQIIDAASEYYDIPVIHIKSPRRHVQFVRPRRLVMYLAREHTEYSLPMIGRQIGGRDHTTIHAGYAAIDVLVRAGDQRTLDDLSVIRAMLGLT